MATNKLADLKNRINTIIENIESLKKEIECKQSILDKEQKIKAAVQNLFLLMTFRLKQRSLHYRSEFVVWRMNLNKQKPGYKKLRVNWKRPARLLTKVIGMFMDKKGL